MQEIKMNTGKSVRINNQKGFTLVEIICVLIIMGVMVSVAIKKFQSALKINAVQLVNESDTFRIFSHEGCSILVASAYQWLSQLS